MNLYQVTHFDYAQGKRVISGHISGTDVYAAKYGFWATEVDGPLGITPSRRNELNVIGGAKYTFTKIGTLSSAIEDAREPQPEQDSCNPAKKDCIRVGKYTRATDPSVVERLRADGYNTSNENIGLYVLESDPDMFDNLLRSGAC